MIKTSCEHQMEIRMPATLPNIDQVCGQMRGFLAKQDLDQHYFSVSLVVREALNNAVVHGCAADSQKEIRFLMEIENNDIVMEIEDPGEGFNWRQQMKIEAGVEDIHGRGMSIFDHYCNQYEYNDKGNRVRLRKSLAR